MRYVVLKKVDFNSFIIKLKQIHKVVAPVAKGYNNFVFKEVESGEEIALNYIPTILPPKKYIMPPYEKIIEYNKKGDIFEGVMEYEKTIVFGVHTCDLAGIQCLNIVFSDKPKDLNYLLRKNKIFIIGIECNEYCDEYASCNIMRNHLPQGGYDLFFTELKDDFIIHINTNDGEQIIEEIGIFNNTEDIHFKQLEKIRKKKRQIFHEEVNVSHKGLKGLFDKAFESKVWDDLDKRCISCCNCTNVCPTCYCFDIFDDINLDLNTGCRIRRWDSCQSEMFAEIAGGENFRKKRGERQRHRYMRKFKYPVQRYSRYFCTGCGRCSRTCMAKIDLKETINNLAEELL